MIEWLVIKKIPGSFRDLGIMGSLCSASTFVAELWCTASIGGPLAFNWVLGVVATICRLSLVLWLLLCNLLDSSRLWSTYDKGLCPRADEVVLLGSVVGYEAGLDPDVDFHSRSARHIRSWTRDCQGNVATR